MNEDHKELYDMVDKLKEKYTNIIVAVTIPEGLLTFHATQDRYVYNGMINIIASRAADECPEIVDWERNR